MQPGGGLNCTVVHYGSSSTGFRVFQEGPSGGYQVQLVVGWLLS